MRLAPGFILGVLFTALVSCMTRTGPVGVVDATPPEPPYRYFEIGDVYQIHAESDAGLEAALGRIGCRDRLVCAIEPAGRVWIVEVFR